MITIWSGIGSERLVLKLSVIDSSHHHLFTRSYLFGPYRNSVDVGYVVPFFLRWEQCPTKSMCVADWYILILDISVHISPNEFVSLSMGDYRTSINKIFCIFLVLYTNFKWIYSLRSLFYLWNVAFKNISLKNLIRIPPYLNWKLSKQKISIMCSEYALSTSIQRNKKVIKCETLNAISQISNPQKKTKFCKIHKRNITI